MSQYNFKVGDKVKIVKRVTEKSPDFLNSWVTTMDENIGSTQTIVRINEFGIFFKNTVYSYPPKSLVKIGFSDFDEVHSFLKRGGYIVVELEAGDPCTVVSYRFKNRRLEINSLSLSEGWDRSLYSIGDLLSGRIAPVSQITKRKYYVHP